MLASYPGLTPELGILMGTLAALVLSILFGALVILMTLLGGVGTLFGPLVGASVVVSLQTQLAQSPLGNWVSVILGAISVTCVLSFRSGIVGEIQKVVKKNFR